MVGVLTMSSPLEDYTIQPCKKQRKAEDPSSKTITNYFSPLSKNVEKVLSSPRSSNIADYFIKSAPLADKECSPRDKRTSPDRGTRNNHTPATPVTGTSKTTRRLTKQAKRTRLIKRLTDLNPNSESDVGVNDDRKSPEAATVCGNTGFMGSDTAALLAEICNKAGNLDVDLLELENPIVVTRSQRKRKKDSESEPSMQPVVPVTDPLELQTSVAHCSSDSKSTVIDSSLEVQVDNKSSNLGNLTISFEDFLKSQVEKDQSMSEACSRVVSVDCSDLCSGNDDNDLESSRQPSPKMVTVQAQVHLSPPLLNSYLPNTTKIASIFQKKKDYDVKKKVDPRAFECDPVGPLIQKRKSNVVVQEEDLELAVIDVESIQPMKQNCSTAERQQFMKAFRQVGETSKNSGKKTIGRKKDVNIITKDVDDGHNKLECERELLDNDGNNGGCSAKNQRLENPKKLKNRIKGAKVNVDSHKNNDPSTSERAYSRDKTELPVESDCPVLRRSLRKHKSDTLTKSPEKTRSDGPLLMSTPKMKPPCRKSDLYMAEVLTVPSDTDSPIRMRFTRLSRKRAGRRNNSVCDEVFTPGCKKVCTSSKKISKAKQIVQKAKAIQQNIVKTPHRRSARQQKRASQFSLKDPIIIDETSNSCSSQREAEKNSYLRSLNDVLGKKMRATNIPSGQRKDLKKKMDKCSVIMIDDGSEVSENSQDDEQFKAKREFLQSGLPDSLKRHIAKNTALREAYFSNCSFQTAIHVQQKDGCFMWDLGFPLCPLLTKVSALCTDVADVTRLTISIGDFTCLNTTSAVKQHTGMVSKRSEFSEVIKDFLLEEIRSHNPPFPVKRFFKQFLKKQSDYLALQSTNKSEMLEKCLRETSVGNEASDSPVEDASNRTKCKKKDFPGTESKRRKPAKDKGDFHEEHDLQPQCGDGEHAPSTRTTRGHRSRSSRRKANVSLEPDVVIEEKITVGENTIWEDVLWTEKYQPQHSEDLIGNSAAVMRLHSWLRDWKHRAEKEEIRNQIQSTGKDENDTWNLGDFHDSEDSDEESLCNTVLITGPPGVGKTAAVYACAQELGFKVFEVNASCQRSGRQILAQLKEATQSHQVDQQGVNIHKPCFFTSYSTGKSPRKLLSPKRVVSSPRKPPLSPRGSGLKKGLAPKSLVNFFKAATKQTADDKKPDIAKEIQSNSARKSHDGKSSIIPPVATDKGTGADESQRKSATSLILFEEVDVIFDDDSGFLNAIKMFMSTTKRPVILTTSDPMFGMVFDGAFEEITFHTPSVVNVASYLQVLCLAENIRTDFKDFVTFLTANKCDIRQSILHLQFWARSGGEGFREKQQLTPGNHRKLMSATVKDVGNSCNNVKSEIAVKDLPGTHFGCAENLMGLNNIIAPSKGLISFVKGKIIETEEWVRILQLLAEFQMRRVDFITSNLEFLLPLPLRIVEPQINYPCENPDLTPHTDTGCPNKDGNVKVSVQMKHKKKLVLLNDSDLFESDVNSLDDLLSLAPEKTIPSEVEVQNSSCMDDVVNKLSGTPVAKRKLLPEDTKSSLLVYRCLDSLADFADNMSSLDCATCYTTGQAEICSRKWTESRLKHGLCDGLRTEANDLWSTQSCSEIQALIEALSFRKCSTELSKALDSSLELCKLSGKDPTEELTLHVSKAREEVHFGQTASSRNVSESRSSVVKTVLSNRAFVSLGNRQENVTEYLPTLRTICRLQKAKEEGKTKRRFLHYLEGIHLELPKTTLNRLAADFP
ncbi:ATPase family AAA domain-containing protein 5 isoform X2 [Pseudophryne corroboree]|uniref:ATPase family AAA domain-containing protein 5 isoform X2 n=1 Tax=Pseudophryne corroboree TaxID=495146 RepID=UPI0030812186